MNQTKLEYQFSDWMKGIVFPLHLFKSGETTFNGIAYKKEYLSSDAIEQSSQELAYTLSVNLNKQIFNQLNNISFLDLDKSISVDVVAALIKMLHDKKVPSPYIVVVPDYQYLVLEDSALQGYEKQSICPAILQALKHLKISLDWKDIEICPLVNLPQSYAYDEKVEFYVLGQDSLTTSPMETTLEMAANQIYADCIYGLEVTNPEHGFRISILNSSE